MSDPLTIRIESDDLEELEKILKHPYLPDFKLEDKGLVNHDMRTTLGYTPNDDRFRMLDATLKEFTMRTHHEEFDVQPITEPVPVKICSECNLEYTENSPTCLKCNSSIFEEDYRIRTVDRVSFTKEPNASIHLIISVGCLGENLTHYIYSDGKIVHEYAELMSQKKIVDMIL